MSEATSEALNNYAEDEALKRFCIIFGVAQSNKKYRILSAMGKAEMMELIEKETADLMARLRGSEKCDVGQVWDEARGMCV